MVLVVSEETGDISIAEPYGASQPQAIARSPARDADQAPRPKHRDGSSSGGGMNNGKYTRKFSLDFRRFHTDAAWPLPAQQGRGNGGVGGQCAGRFLCPEFRQQPMAEFFAAAMNRQSLYSAIPGHCSGPHR